MLINRQGIRHAGEFKNGNVSGSGVRNYPEGSNCTQRRGNFTASRLPSARPPYSGRRRKTGRELDEEDVVQSGLGEVRFTNGDYGAGNFREHTLDGPGVYHYGPGESVLASFEGELAEGVSHGLGRLRFRSGATYDGEFKEDEPDCFGILRSKDGLDSSPAAPR